MALASLADLADLMIRVRTHRADGTPIDVELLERSLLVASDTIRNYCNGDSISYVEGDTVTLRGNLSQRLVLPGSEVWDVRDVSIDGEPVTDYAINRAGYIRRPSSWGNIDAEVTLTYDHGMHVVPERLQEIALELAQGKLAAIIQTANTTTSVATGAPTYMQLGGFQVRYDGETSISSESGSIASLNRDDKKYLDDWRARQGRLIATRP